MRRRTMICGTVIPFVSRAAGAEPDVIENQTFRDGLSLSKRDNLVIRRCTFSNPKGPYGLALTDCNNVVVEDCTVTRIGNETMPDSQVRSIGGFEFVPLGAAGIKLDRCSSARIVRTDITDCFGKGIYVTAQQWEQAVDTVIEGCRIAYIYDDGILFAKPNDQSAPIPAMPLKGAILRDNIIHDIGLGLSRLPFARHGMYLKVRDVLVEGNTIFNCFFGEGISMRNAGVARNNKVRNCARACISYWAQTATNDSSEEVRIERNECRQDFALPVPMRHIDFPERLHHLPLGAIVLQHSDNEYARIKRFVVRDNVLMMGRDYLDRAPVIAGNGNAQKSTAEFEIVDNTLRDLRAEPAFFGGLPRGVDLTGNELRTS